MKSYNFTFPLPPTTNATYYANYSTRLKRTVFHQTYVAKKWKKQVQDDIKSSYPTLELITQGVAVVVKWYLKFNRDIDGGIKIILDSFEKTLIDNDRQIKELHIYKDKDKVSPRVEISISLLE